MMYGRIALAITVAAATLLPNAGCLRRKETITVNPDQSVRIDIEYQGDRPDLGGPDAMPSKEAGWDAKTVSQEKEDGDKEYTLTAGQTFAPGAALPSSFAAAGDPDAELYLRFPTTLQAERRAGETIYTLRRVYTARPWAYVQFWEDQILKGDVKKLLDKPENELTTEEQEQILRALATVEVARRLEIFRTAMERSGVEQYEADWLEARRALLNHVEEINFEPILALHEAAEAAADDSPARQAAEEKLNSAISQMSDAGLRAFEDQLAASLGEARLTQYDRALQRVRKEYEVTKETGGHAFEIRVKMPGRVIGHNGDKVEEDGTVVWEFDGNAFRDRDHELLVVSRMQSPTAETSR